MYSDDDYIPQYCVLDSHPDKENDSRTTGSSQITGKGFQHQFHSEPCVLRERSGSQSSLASTCDLELDPKPKTRSTIVQRKSVESRPELGSGQSRDTSAAGPSTSHVPVTNTFSEVLDAVRLRVKILYRLPSWVKPSGSSTSRWKIRNAGISLVQELLASKLGAVQNINLEQVKNLQSAVHTLRPSSDLVVRDVEAVMKALTNTVAGLCLTRTSFHITKFKESCTLPEGVEFKRENITRTWKLDANPPFKEVNMIQIFEIWSPSARAKRGDHFLSVLEFLRFYLLQACEPAREIQHFACRQSGKKGRYPHLLDFPETIVVFLTNSILDAFGLFADELLLSAAECARYANSYWHTLGENDEQRKKRFDKLVQARFTWNGNIRNAITRALGDLRAYSFKPEKNELVPPTKKRTCTIAVATDPVQFRNEDEEYELETV